MLQNKTIVISSQISMGHQVPVLKLADYFSKANNVYFINHSHIKFEKKFSSINFINEKGARNHPELVAQLKSHLEFLKPDITIQDFYPELNIAANICNIKCKASIMRPELFIGHQIVNTELQPKFDCAYNHGYLHPEKNYRCFKELFIDDLIILPGIPEIDSIPVKLLYYYDKTKIVYSGPLNDIFILDHLDNLNIKWFIEKKNEGKKIIFITLGTAWNDYKICERIYQELTGNQFAFIFAVESEEVLDKLTCYVKNDENAMVLPLVDLDLVLKYSDIAIHHCGHGMFYLCLEYQIPSVIIKSGDHDRDDNASILAQKGLAYVLKDFSELTFSIMHLLVSMRNNLRNYSDIIKSYKTNNKGIKRVEDSISELCN
jgi:UDP:flavonoid glycosyltransferase YjiC (YdhE family)